MPTDLDALAALAREATQGEWDHRSVGIEYVVADVTDIARVRRKEDAAYIAAANPAVVLGLIERVQRAEADAVRFRHIIAGADHFPDPEPRPDAPISWGWSVQWGCWTHEGVDIRSAIDATMTAGD